MKRKMSVRNTHRNLMLENLEARHPMAADFAPQELLIQYEPTAISDITSLTSAQSASVIQRLDTQTIGSVGIARVKIPLGKDLQIAAKEFEKLPGVLSAEPNWVVRRSAVSNDPVYTSGFQWGAYSNDSPANVGGPLTTNPFGSGAEEAWGAGAVGSHQVVVAILDEGVDIQHEDLRSNVWVNPGEIANDGIDNDSNGHIDDLNGWDFFNDDKTVYDGMDDHGTHVAGTIGAVGGNGVGVAGIAWDVSLMPIKVLGPDGGYISDVIDGINYVVAAKNRGVNVVAMNNSWGTLDYSQALHAAFIRAANAGILCIASAGNEGSSNDLLPQYPASFSTLVGAPGQPAASYESIISVAAISSNGQMPIWSNFGATSVDIGAPGDDIQSTLPGNRYGSWSGTSMAAPHVSGAVALIAATKPSYQPSSIREAILRSAPTTSSLVNRVSTSGRLSVQDAIEFTQWPVLSISNASNYESINRQSGWIDFQITLSDSLDERFTLSYSTQNGSATQGVDFVPTSGTATFAPGQTSATIRVPLIDDRIAEPNENFFVNLFGLSTVSARFGNAQASGTILNDDILLGINDVQGAESAGFFRFVVSLNSPSRDPVSVRVSTADGLAKATNFADYASLLTTLVFNPGETNKVIAVRIRNDAISEPLERFFVNLTSPVGAAIADAQGSGTIIDDDGPRRSGMSPSSMPPDSLSVFDWNDLLGESVQRRKIRRHA